MSGRCVAFIAPSSTAAGAALFAASVATALLSRFAAGGEPVVLKLAFFSADRTHLYLSSMVKAIRCRCAG